MNSKNATNQQNLSILSSPKLWVVGNPLIVVNDDLILIKANPFCFHVFKQEKLLEIIRWDCEIVDAVLVRIDKEQQLFVAFKNGTINRYSIDKLLQQDFSTNHAVSKNTKRQRPNERKIDSISSLKTFTRKLSINSTDAESLSFAEQPGVYKLHISPIGLLSCSSLLPLTLFPFSKKGDIRFSQSPKSIITSLICLSPTKTTKESFIFKVSRPWYNAIFDSNTTLLQHSLVVYGDFRGNVSYSPLFIDGQTASAQRISTISSQPLLELGEPIHAIHYIHPSGSAIGHYSLEYLIILGLYGKLVMLGISQQQFMLKKEFQVFSGSALTSSCFHNSTLVFVAGGNVHLVDLLSSLIPPSSGVSSKFQSSSVPIAQQLLVGHNILLCHSPFQQKQLTFRNDNADHPSNRYQNDIFFLGRDGRIVKIRLPAQNLLISPMSSHSGSQQRVKNQLERLAEISVKQKDLKIQKQLRNEQLKDLNTASHILYDHKQSQSIVCQLSTVVHSSSPLSKRTLISVTITNKGKYDLTCQEGSWVHILRIEKQHSSKNVVCFHSTPIDSCPKGVEWNMNYPVDYGNGGVLRVSSFLCYFTPPSMNFADCISVLLCTKEFDILDFIVPSQQGAINKTTRKSLSSESIFDGNRAFPLIMHHSTSSSHTNNNNNNNTQLNSESMDELRTDIILSNTSNMLIQSNMRILISPPFLPSEISANQLANLLQLTRNVASNTDNTSRNILLRFTSYTDDRILIKILPTSRENITLYQITIQCPVYRSISIRSALLKGLLMEQQKRLGSLSQTERRSLSIKPLFDLFPHFKQTKDGLLKRHGELLDIIENTKTLGGKRQHLEILQAIISLKELYLQFRDQVHSAFAY